MQLAKPLRIAIIGAGASGTLLTVQLCRLAGSAPLRIFLIDKTGNKGKGLAYSTSDPLHLLNVPAGKMSALPSDPDHFISWLTQQNLPFTASDFVPRYLYGHYLTHLLNQTAAGALSSVTLQLINQEAVSLNRNGNETCIQLSDGSEIIADKVVLALGNFPPGKPCSALDKLTGTSLYAADPWQDGIFAGLNADDPVLLIGSGLTMADIAVSLFARQHKGAVLAVSTHGYLPNHHIQSPPYTHLSEEISALKTVKEWLPFIRKHIKRAENLGLNWRAVVDAFRPFSQSYWLNLSVEEKRKFMRHLRHFWSIARHRMPPATAEIINLMQRSGQLQIWNGRVENVMLNQGVIEATILRRKGGRVLFRARKVVNCTGPESDYRKVKSALVHDILQKGFVAPDPLFLGLAATPDGHLIDKNNQKLDWLLSIGPPLKGVLWESTAIPEIREQAQTLAKKLLP